MKWLLLIFPLACFGQVTTYSYQGTSISGFIELAAPLTANATVTITPDIQGFNGVVMALPGTSFTLTTDSAGNIAEWSFDAGLDIACDCTMDVTSTNQQEQATSTKNEVDPGTLLYVPITTIIATNPPGHWTTINGPPMMAMQPQMAKAQIDIRNIANGYMAENAIIAELNAALMQQKQLVYACRVNRGKC